MKLSQLIQVFFIVSTQSLFTVVTSASPFEYDHYTILVRDLDTSVAFYSKVLQLEETFDGTEQPHIRWFSLGDNYQLHIIQSIDAAAIAKHKGVHLALTTPNFDAFVKRLQDNKIPFENWPGEARKSNVRPDGVKQVYIQDPDGYWLEINDASTRWPTPKKPK